MYNNKKILNVLLGITIGIASLTFSKEVKASETNEQKEDLYLKNIKQLTNEGEKNGEGYFSPDGNKIIFQSIREKSKFYQIYSMDLTNKNIKMVSTGRGKTTCAYFSPDGKKIIYASSHLDPQSEKEEENKGKGYKWDFEKSLDIFEANPDGSDLKQLTTTPGYDAEGTYSNDGKKIVFTSQRDGDLEIYVMNADGSGQKRLTNHKGYDGGAFFSPDNQKIVYRRFDDKGNAQIMLMNADGTGEKQLTDTKAINWCPSFYPDGKHIIFSSNLNEPRNFELFIMDLDGEHLRQLTFNKATDILPVFSPDGKKLMWTSTRADNKSQIFTADFNTDILNESAKISKKLYSDLKYLASDALEGRRSGSAGADKAAKYIAKQFKTIGLKPGNNSRNSYLQNFNVTVGIKLGKNNFFMFKNAKKSINAVLAKDFIPLSFSDNGKVSGNLVFAGYGISAPEYNYDDYKGIDVNGKTVIILRHEPQEKNEKSIFNGNKPTPYSELRYKAFNAKKHGAKAVILLNGPVNYTEKEDELIPLRTFGGTGNIGLPMIHLKNSFLQSNFKNNSFDLKSIQSSIDNHLKPDSFALKNTINLSIDLKRDVKHTSNVIGYLEGTDKKLKNEVIVIGAHYDHLGYGGEESLSTSKEPEIHNGADDNASGTSALIELARNLAGIKLNRTLVFMAFSGEELGLLGSSYFTSHPSFKNIISMLNMDMVGRLEEDNLYIGGIKTAANFNNLVDNLNFRYQFKMSYFNDGYGPSDHMAFYLKNIPVLFFFTGVHNDYHRPSDDYYKINFIGMNKIINFIQDITINLDNLPEKPKLVKIAPDPNMASTSTGKSSGAYLGTIPDYTSMNSSTGVKLSGVREGSPADKGGLKAEDIIIKFDNIKINTIYDYTYAIRAKKPGDKVKITVLRNNKELVLNLIMGKK